MLTYLLIWMVACKGTAPDAKPVDSDTRPSIPVPTTETSTTGPLPCAEALVPALEWFDVDPIATWEGSLELGQTHVIREVEDRLAPSLSAERETLLLFHPTEAIEEAVDVRVAAFAGEDLLGVLAMSPPSQLPQALEQGLTSVTLDPYSVSAWSANLPWSWMMEGVELRIAHLDDAGLTQRTTALTGLAPPHVYTINRTKTMYFGGGEEDLSTLPGPRLAQDHFSTVPGAELRLVEVTPWRLDELVVNTDQGPRLVRSEGERQSTTNSVDRWDLLKYQVSLRHSLANTGRGLSLVHPWEGDSSPYSYGTSLGMGWVVNDDGSWSDLNNAPYAAGWTGWTSIWLSECGNTLTHELGHSYTLLHFVAGTSAAWGIEDEYPLDGVNLPDHPWGYDTTRRALRTWYEVTSAGPVDDGYGLSGKHDPMNGGDSANALHCYPQYTAYTAGWIQDWATGAPTLMDVQGTPGAYLWNAEAKQYDLVEASSSDGEPLAVDVPVLTFVGTLGNADEACQTYPPRRASLGNVFALPDPEDPDLPSVFDGAQWFVEILYADGRVERGLIARSEIAAADVSMYLYSFNIKAEDDPIQVDLLRSPTGHPSIDISAAERVHTRIIEPSADPVLDPIRVGRGYVANAGLALSQLCTPDVDCDHRRLTSTWRGASSQRHFDHEDVGAAETCMDVDAVSVLELPAVDGTGAPATVIAHAQRLLAAGNQQIAVPLNDITPWLGAPDLEQSLRIWLPYEPNSALPAGSYTLEQPVGIDALLDGTRDATTPLSLDLTVYDLEDVDFNALSDGYWTHPVYEADSSVYFTVSDATMGPTWGDWWNASESSHTLWPLVVDQTTGEVTTLTLDAYKVACGDWWGFNTGQSSYWNCDNRAALYISAAGNDHLVSGHTYVSPGSSPLIVQARRWHAPGAGSVLAEFPLRVHYTAP